MAPAQAGVVLRYRTRSQRRRRTPTTLCPFSWCCQQNKGFSCAVGVNKDGGRCQKNKPHTL